MIERALYTIIVGTVKDFIGEDAPVFSFEFSENPKHGDYAATIAFVLAKKMQKNPLAVAEELKQKLLVSEDLQKIVEHIEIAGGGFLNFFLKREVFARTVKEAVEGSEKFGKNLLFSGKKIIVEYTDPNPFKEFHIGHLMPNVIGESLARAFEFSSGEVKRANYQGDIGLHAAKAIWAFFKREDGDIEPLALGVDYALGNRAYEEDPRAKEEIDAINKKMYERSDQRINEIYDRGRKKSLDMFEDVYEKLGTKFDFYFFESAVESVGKQVVEEGLARGIFEKSEGAIVFRGEKYGLHTRVFINSQGLPTYEAKELGLSKVKYEKYPYDLSYIVTGNEVIEYFKVLLCAMNLLYPELASKTKHISHGMLRLSHGKMSSRTGLVITFETLFEQIKQALAQKVPEMNNNAGLLESVAMGAIKYSILKQSTGKDIIFDFNTSLSLEGDSGPYVQYAYARARSVLRKAAERNIRFSSLNIPERVEEVERLLLWFPEIVKRTVEECEPHYVATYLGKLAKAFNSFYAREKIIDSEFVTYRLSLTEAVAVVLKNGLWILGIETPEKM